MLHLYESSACTNLSQMDESNKKSKKMLAIKDIEFTFLKTLGKFLFFWVWTRIIYSVANESKTGKDSDSSNDSA